MRMLAICTLVLFGLFGATHSQAQTWENPLVFSTNPYYSYQNTCYQPAQNLIFDFGEYQVYAPAVIYRAWNLQLPFPHPKTTFKPWIVTMVPQFGTDLSIWVCRSHNGASVSNCVDVSDNGPSLMNTVTVPAQAGIFYVVVTAGVYQTNPACGTYSLSASHY